MKGVMYVRKALFLLVIITLLPTIFSGCGLLNQQSSDQLNALAAVEVKNYEGRDLSSILDFHENSISGPQKIDISTYLLKIDGLVANPQELTYNQVLSHKPYSKVVTLYCVENWAVTILWEGFLMKDLLDAAKVDGTANTVIFHAVDGYTTSIPLQTILDKNMILAYKINGVVLPPERGYPFQLVAEDKLGYKWIKWITRIELSDDVNYKGYWESKGYDNTADVQK